MTVPANEAGSCLAAARAGSRDALGQALQACRDYLHLIAQQELTPDLRAKGGPSDLVQETFVDAQRLFARFQGTSEAEWRAWLRQLLLNNVADFSRRYHAAAKRRVGREVPLEAGDSSAERGGGLAADMSSPSARAMAPERAAALERALERLPEEYRQVLTLRYQNDLSFEAIGRQLGRSANAARKLWLRAVRRLEQDLGVPP